MASLGKHNFMKTTFILLLAILGLLACNKEPANFEGGDPGYQSAPPALAKRVANSKAKERKLIKTGRIEFSTENIAHMHTEIDKVVKEFNAYISSDNQQKFDGKIQYEQVVRVPANRFDGFVKVIEELGGEIEFRNFDAQDVTEEYIDIEARLKTKKELEVRYHQLLKEAKNVEEMLAVETQIANVRSEIESMQGRINFLADQVGHSTLTLNYYQLISPQLGFGSKLVASFASGWQGFLAFLVGLTAIWPFILILSVSLWFLSRWSKRFNLKFVKKTEQN
jgi:hypothetical protein